MGRRKRGYPQHDHGKDCRQCIAGTDGPARNIRVSDGRLPLLRHTGGKGGIGKGYSGSVPGLIVASFRASLVHSCKSFYETSAKRIMDFRLNLAVIRLSMSDLPLFRSPTLDRPKAEFSSFVQGDGLVTPPISSA